LCCLFDFDKNATILLWIEDGGVRGDRSTSAVVFPGQGLQWWGMILDFDAASHILGLDIRAIIRDEDPRFDMAL
jgi:hypothetical protein